MRIVVLGCGGSSGVPRIGGGDGTGEWGACDPADDRNRRTRSSLLVQDGGATVLIDTSPDLRTQLLRARVKDISAVLYTHTHADHVHGIDDLRVLASRRRGRIDVYGSRETIDDLRKRFGYLFDGCGFYPPALDPHVLSEPVTIGGLVIQPFAQGHGGDHTTGYRIGDVAYSTDVEHLDESAFTVLEGVKLWVVDCLQMEPHPTHAHFARAIEWIERVRPQRAVLTHLGTRLDYATLRGLCPPGVEPAYDQLTIEL